MHDDLTGAPRAAFDAFSRALEVIPIHRVRLRPGDVLAVDNHRMLHGRTRSKRPVETVFRLGDVRAMLRA